MIERRVAGVRALFVDPSRRGNAGGCGEQWQCPISPFSSSATTRRANSRAACGRCTNIRRAVARGRRDRQRVDRRQRRRCPLAIAGRSRHRAHLNVGFAAPTTKASARPRATVLLLNSDTDCTGGRSTAVAAYAIFPAHPSSGRGSSGTVPPELSFGRMLRPVAELRQKMLVAACAPPLAARGNDVPPRPVDWVSGACLLVRRQDAEAAGLLDERYFMYCEDVDFCAAIRAGGGTVYFAPRPRWSTCAADLGAPAPAPTARAIVAASSPSTKAPPAVGSASKDVSRLPGSYRRNGR